MSQIGMVWLSWTQELKDQILTKDIGALVSKFWYTFDCKDRYLELEWILLMFDLSQYASNVCFYTELGFRPGFHKVSLWQLECRKKCNEISDCILTNICSWTWVDIILANFIWLWHAIVYKNWIQSKSNLDTLCVCTANM